MPNPRKHSAVIKAWADGATIQYKSIIDMEWRDLDDNPRWDPKSEYRVKPKPDVVAYIGATMPLRLLSPFEAAQQGLCSYASFTQTSLDNIKCVFDGETGELKSVEIV